MQVGSASGPRKVQAATQQVVVQGGIDEGSEQTKVLERGSHVTELDTRLVAGLDGKAQLRTRCQPDGERQEHRSEHWNDHIEGFAAEE